MVGLPTKTNIKFIKFQRLGHLWHFEHFANVIEWLINYRNQFQTIQLMQINFLD